MLYTRNAVIAFYMLLICRVACITTCWRLLKIYVVQAGESELLKSPIVTAKSFPPSLHTFSEAFQSNRWKREKLRSLERNLPGSSRHHNAHKANLRQFLQYNTDGIDFDAFPLAVETTEQPEIVVIRPKPFSISEQLKLEQSETLPGAITELHDSVYKPSNTKPMKQKPKQSKNKNNSKNRNKNKATTKADNNKNKRKGSNTNKKKKPTEQHNALVGQPAHVIFTTVTTEKPHYYPTAATTTALPHYKKKIKYILSKHNALKKIKKEYLSHLGHVFYPFVKFVAFFTVLNPFTFGVFFFSLISPIVFGILGFVALSFFIKPALHLLFDVKRRVGAIDRKRYHEKRRRERIRENRRPITIHKHYYQHPGGGTSAVHRNGSVERHQRKGHNPLLPHIHSHIENKYRVPDFIRPKPFKHTHGDSSVEFSLL